MKIRKSNPFAKAKSSVKGMVGRPSEARAKKVVSDFWASKSQQAPRPTAYPATPVSALAKAAGNLGNSQNPYAFAEQFNAERKAEKTLRDMTGGDE